MEDRRQPTTPRRLCRLDEIADPGSAGFTIPSVDGPVEVMVIRRGHRAFVYVNLCPHWDAPLDMKPGQFLDRARQHIQCANHGAVFRIEDGFCLAGPCRGASLRTVPCAIVGDDVVLTGSLA